MLTISPQQTVRVHFLQYLGVYLATTLFSSPPKLRLFPRGTFSSGLKRPLCVSMGCGEGRARATARLCPPRPAVDMLSRHLPYLHHWYNTSDFHASRRICGRKAQGSKGGMGQRVDHQRFPGDGRAGRICSTCETSVAPDPCVLSPYTCVMIYDPRRVERPKNGSRS